MDRDDDRVHDRWAELRFSIVGPLLAAPPKRGELCAALEQLAQTTWRHPITGEPTRFGLSTLERWYYAARGAPRDPVGELRRKLRKDAGEHPSLSLALREVLRDQYRAHPSWSMQLHADNLAVLASENPSLGPMPSATTIRRYMRSQGMVRERRVRGPRSPGALRARQRLETREVRSFEAEYALALWHLDYHHGSRKLLLRDGSRVQPKLLGILDDRSRLACHVQWYLDETAETLVHGLSQAFQKRGLPRALLTDNGSAMLAAEVRQGLRDLGVVHDTTLPYSPFQNAKQEVFWASVEGRLLAMLEGCEELTLDLLNEATQAWVEGEYNQRFHSELGTSPLRRFLEGPDVGRECPGSDVLRQAFRAELTRTQRRSDGTVSVFGCRFEVPSRYRWLERVRIRAARWDLRTLDLVDPRTGQILCALYPLDKARNADGQRRRLDPNPAQLPEIDPSSRPASEIAPLLRQLMASYAATGLPPAYLPQTNAAHDDPEKANP
jgi:transposase InsO family protein